MNDDCRAGIVSWGIYVPPLRVDANAIAHARAVQKNSTIDNAWADAACSRLGIKQIALPSLAEDSTTMAIDACSKAIHRAGIAPRAVEALYLGGESRGEYKVRPTSAIVANALGIGPHVRVKDIDAACVGGLLAVEDCVTAAKAGLIRTAVAVGADVSLYPPGHSELTQGAGAAAFVIGSGPKVTARILASSGVSTNADDFFRRTGQAFPYLNPESSKRLYLAMCDMVTKDILAKLSMPIGAFDFIALHVPYESLALRFARDVLKLSSAEIDLKIRPCLLAHATGNTYTASPLLSLSRALDLAEPDNRILVCAYGSGCLAHSIALETTATKTIEKGRQSASGLVSLDPNPVGYSAYTAWRKQYLRLREKGGRAFDLTCRIAPTTRKTKTVYICHQCGRMQGPLPQGLCAYDDCRGTIGALKLPEKARITTLRATATDLLRSIAQGWYPTSVTKELWRDSRSLHVHLAIRVITNGAPTGAVNYGPAYVLPEQSTGTKGKTGDKPQR